MQRKLKSYTDAELLSRFKQNRSDSEAAFAEIYYRYSSKIHAYCVRMLNDDDAAEDIYQDTFIKFYQNVDPTRTELNVSSFLLTIARNLCFNYFRDKKQSVPIENMDFSTGSSDLNERKELLDMITMALDLLPIEYKESFILREYDGLGYEEIANISGLTVSNAKTRVRRAKIKLKEILEPYLNETYF